MSPKELHYEFTTEDLSDDGVRGSLSLPSTRQGSPESNMLKKPKKKPVVIDFLVFFIAALYATTYLEASAGQNFPSSQAVEEDTSAAPILDVGFVLTQPLYELLKANRGLNDVLAFINSLSLLIPLLYSFYVTVFRGDYSLIFRITACQILRTVCGYLTHLPPHSSYLASNYDYPDIIHCMAQECSGEPEVMPFISFYSGHVTNMVIGGNDMWLRGFRPLSLLLHALNVFQIVRMLATRGHYTIDIVCGWIVAVYFSGQAANLGRRYNEGETLAELLLPRTLAQAFDTMTGLSVVKQELPDFKESEEDRSFAKCSQIYQEFQRQDDDSNGREEGRDQAESCSSRTPSPLTFDRSPSLAYSSTSSTVS